MKWCKTGWRRGEWEGTSGTLSSRADPALCVRPTCRVVTEVVIGELQLTKLCIAERNPKSYCAWFHRQWVVER